MDIHFAVCIPDLFYSEYCWLFGRLEEHEVLTLNLIKIQTSKLTSADFLAIKTRVEQEITHTLRCQQLLKNSDQPFSNLQNIFKKPCEWHWLEIFLEVESIFIF